MPGTHGYQPGIAGIILVQTLLEHFSLKISLVKAGKGPTRYNYSATDGTTLDTMGAWVWVVGGPYYQDRWVGILFCLFTTTAVLLVLLHLSWVMMLIVVQQQ